MSAFQNWRAYLRNCTDKQIQGVYEKEKSRLELELDDETRKDSQAAVDACLVEDEMRDLHLLQLIRGEYK